MPNQKNDQINWCKILNMPDRHVLVERIFDVDRERESVRISTPLKIVHGAATIGFAIEKQADEFYASLTDETIGGWFDQCFKEIVEAETETLAENEEE